MPFLAVAVSILMFGGVVTVFAYIAFCCVVKIRRIIKRFNYKGMLQSRLPSRIHGKRIRFAGHIVKTHAPQQLKEEQTFVGELFNSSRDCFYTKMNQLKKLKI